MARRLLWCSSYLTHSSSVGGLVPTRDMSPFKTFQNCGNSSKDQSRIKFPIPFFTVPSGSCLQPMIRGSKSSLNISPSVTLFSAASCALRSSASVYILRNLYSLNFFPFFPTRIWEKNTGPGDWILMAGARNRNRIPVSTHPTSPPIISNRRFTNSSPVEIVLMLVVNTVYPPRRSTNCRCVPTISLSASWICTVIPISFNCRMRSSSWALCNGRFTNTSSTHSLQRYSTT